MKKPVLVIVAAVNSNRYAIGKNKHLPWEASTYCPMDQLFYQRLIAHEPRQGPPYLQPFLSQPDQAEAIILLGKETSTSPIYQDLRTKKNVRIVVISTSEGEFGSVRDACESLGDNDMYVVGGQRIYKETLADRWIRDHFRVVVLLTHLWNEVTPGDRFFPFDAMITSTTHHENITVPTGEWLGISKEELPTSYTFMLYT